MNYTLLFQHHFQMLKNKKDSYYFRFFLSLASEIKTSLVISSISFSTDLSGSSIALLKLILKFSIKN